jgi:hypothetical protein
VDNGSFKDDDEECNDIGDWQATKANDLDLLMRATRDCVLPIARYVIHHSPTNGATQSSRQPSDKCSERS